MASAPVRCSVLLPCATLCCPVFELDLLKTQLLHVLKSIHCALARSRRLTAHAFIRANQLPFKSRAHHL
jgi:hypothetical protein